jgi:radical SAM protein with 4Fe4S-binding SPASM domain
VGAAFSVDIPWRLDGEPIVRIEFRDERFLGSRRHYLRFDLYPLNAPSTLGRHYAYWDIPMRYVKDNRFDVLLRDGKLIVDRGWRRVRIKPKWTGSLEPLGYCTLHVSLWDRRTRPSEMLAVKSSVHVISPPGKDLPLQHVHLTMTQRCNLDCLMCVRPHAHGLVEADVTEAILGPVLDAGPALSSVSAMGLGEPLLNPRFCQIVQDFKRVMPLHGTVGTNTNGTLIDHRLAEQLVETGLNWISFSLDGATKETTERIRRGLDFDRVLRGIEHVVDYRLKSARKNLSLGSNFVIQEHNLSEIPEFVRLAGSLGLDYVSFNHRRDFPSGRFVIQDVDTLAQLFRAATDEGTRNGVKLGLPGLRKHREPRCTFMEMTYVTLAGDVIPCCRVLLETTPEPTIKFGNVKEKPLLEIWEDPAYRAFRRQVVEGDLPDYCKPCEYALGLLHQPA